MRELELALKVGIQKGAIILKDSLCFWKSYIFTYTLVQVLHFEVSA